MSRFIDLTGTRYDRLLVLKRGEHYVLKNHTGYYWICQCDCGKVVKIKGEHLRSGDTHSCGCYALDCRREGTHHLTDTRLFKIWTGMKTRCYNSHSRSFKDYGARGIKLCDEWVTNFMSFYSWAIQNGYSDDLTIDRIDSDGDYSPTNCRWISKQEQARNKRNNHWIEIDGERKLLIDWCTQYNIRPSVVLNRIRRNGWTEKDAIITPVGERRK